MRRFRKILVYYNAERDDPTAIERAIEVARATGASITVMDTVEELNWYARVVDGFDEKTVARARDNAMTLVRERVARLDGSELVSRFEVRVGAPAVEVIREVLRHGHDLVMKVAEGTGGLRSALFGPTARRLLRKCPCPVWILRRDRGSTPRRIVVVIDPDPGDERSLALNRAAVHLAMSLERWFGAGLDVVHAWDLGLYRRARQHVDAASYNAFVAVMESDIRQSLEAFLGSTGGDHLSLSLVEGNPGRVIPALAEKRGADLVVMGSLRPNHADGVLVDDAAEAVFEDLDCSLLALKPADFVSPITLD